MIFAENSVCMDKYYLKLIYNSKYSAGKAREDCDTILERNGYNPISLGSRVGINTLSSLLKFVSVCTLFFRIPKNSILFIQIPAYNKLSMAIYKIAVLRTKRVRVLIHDLVSIRILSVKALKEENYIFHHSEIIIVHTQKMKDLLVYRGISADKIRILTAFDYLSDFQNNEHRSLSNRITFAGNLSKSPFLSLLSRHSDLQFLLYGNLSNHMPQSLNVEYAGKFESNDVSQIKGDWGLVWDGDSDKKCNGLYGEYLKYIASHKLSLYIAAEMPIIVWSESAMCSFVISNHLGISISAISDIKGAIDNLTYSDYERMLMSLRHFSVLLRKGYMFSKILDQMN